MDSTSRGLLIALIVLVGAALGFSLLMGGMMGPGMMEPGMLSGRGWAWGLGMELLRLQGLHLVAVAAELCVWP